MAHVRSNFGDLFLARLPILESVIHMRHERWPSQIPLIYSMESTAEPFRNYTGVSGLGLFGERAERAPAAEDSVRQLYDKKLTPVGYAKALTHSRETLDQDRFGVFNKMNMQLADSAGQTKDILAADLFNLGDTAAGARYLAADGQNIFDNSHPIDDGASTGDNLLASADISNVAVQAALTLLERTKDDRGLPQMIMGTQIVVPSEQRFDAAQVVKSVDDSSTTDRAVSPFVDDNFGYVVWRYLTDPQAWGMVSDFMKMTEGWVWLTQQGLDLDHDVDIRTQTAVTVATERFDYGVIDWRGMVKNPGA